jgi:hypothetical protein
MCGGCRQRAADSLSRALFRRVSFLDGPVLLDGHFACAGAFSRDLARKTRLREFLSHDARAQMTSLTRRGAGAGSDESERSGVVESSRDD